MYKVRVVIDRGPLRGATYTLNQEHDTAETAAAAARDWVERDPVGRIQRGEVQRVAVMLADEQVVWERR